MFNPSPCLRLQYRIHGRTWGAFILALLLAVCGYGSSANWSEVTDDGTDSTADSGYGDSLAGASLQDMIVGIWKVVGSDQRYGSYQGQAEVRVTAEKLSLHHIQTYETASFEGDKIALAWQGEAMAPKTWDEPAKFRVTLDRIGFVASYGANKRAGTDPTPVIFNGAFTMTAPGVLTGTFQPQNGPDDLAFTETWTRIGGPGTQPIWRNQRRLIRTHDLMSQSAKDSAFAVFASFHELPLVKPYTSRPEFQQAMHYAVFDPTDYNFYRANPNVLRVIQKVIDPISLVETRIRNRAYRQRLSDKQAYFDKEMPLHHLNSAGMVVGYNPTGAVTEVPDGNAMLWTGVYVASQAMRYLVTGEAEALRNMLRGLRGQLMCHDIVGQPGQFARTIRVHVNNGSPGWIRGTGAYSAFDYRPGGNNDMLKGYWVGLPWAYLVLKNLPGYQADRHHIVNVVNDLLDNSPIAGDKKINQMTGAMLSYWMTGNLSKRLQYQAIWPAAKLWMVDQANGALWQYGTSDWSGNHLGIQSLLTVYLISKQLNDGHLDDLAQGMKNTLTRMRHTRLGLFQLVAATLGNFAAVPPELADSLWTLREFPAPKVSHNINWTINPSFCLSPFPELFWKNDWTMVDRSKSLYSYPLIEGNPDFFEWKNSPFRYRPPFSSVQYPGADYLFAYWFGRYTDVIDEQM